MPHLLHINDNNLLVQTTAEQGGQVLVRSQGYAWLKGDSVLFDVNHADHPTEHCRIAPQEINNRYWQQCAQTAIAGNGAGMRHAADLIWKHLAELKTKANLDELALVVPANYRDSHLQLLLGVAQANQLNVSGLLSKPVVAAAQHRLPPGDVVHIDVQLHQTVVSQLELGADEVSLQSADTKAELGIHTLQESLLHALQASFIRTDRFDPLHDADTEQQLFNQLPSIVAAGVNGEKATVGVQHQGKLYSATIESGEIVQALSGLVGLLQDYSGHTVMLDTNASFDLSTLADVNTLGVICVDHPAALKANSLVTKNANGEVIYQTSFASNTAPASAAPQREPKIEGMAAASAQSGEQSATHLMQLGLAVALDKATISIENAELNLKANGAASDINAMLKAGELQIINDQNRQTLRANDRLVSPLADGVITAVRVL